MIGQETSLPPITYLESERAPTAKELSLWRQAQVGAKKTIQLSYALKLLYANVGLTHQFAQKRKIVLSETIEDLPALEQRMFSALMDIDRLKVDMCGVEQLELGVRLSSTGNDLDILRPDPQSLGWIIPAVAGALIVAGIIARWVYLEKEVDDITNRYNGIVRRADLQLCKDPNSSVCADWEATKKSGNYYQRETLVQKIGNAARKVGKSISGGLGLGLAILIPMLVLIYLPTPRKEN